MNFRSHSFSILLILLTKITIGQDINTLNLGDGINSNTKRTYPGALVVPSNQILTENTNSTRFKLELIEKSENIFKSSSSSISTSFGVGIFNIDAGLQLINSKKINSYFVYLAVEVEVVTHRKYLSSDAYYFDNNIVSSLNDENLKWDNIFEQFGNKYVNSITYGGKFNALYKFEVGSIEELNSLKADLSGGTMYGSIDANFSNVSSKLSKYKSENINISSFGFNDAIPKSIEELINYSQNFPKIMGSQSGTAIKYEFVEANSIRNIPSSKRSSLSDNNLITQSRLLQKLRENLFIANIQKQNIDYYKQNTQYFIENNYSDDYLDKTYSSISSLADSLELLLDYCTSGQSISMFIPDYPTNLRFNPKKYTQITNKDYRNGKPFAKEIMPTGFSEGPREIPLTILSSGESRRMLIHGYMIFNGTKRLIIEECRNDQVNKNHELYFEFYRLNDDGTQTEIGYKSYFLVADDNQIYDLNYKDFAHLLQGKKLKVAIQYKLQSPDAVRYEQDPAMVFIF